MTYEEALAIVEGLRERMAAPFSFDDKSLIKRTYAEVMGRNMRVTSCKQCWKDAVIEMAVFLNRNKTMADKCNYHMRAGYIIRNDNFDGGKVYSNANLTDDVAARFLAMFPGAVKFFDRIPEQAEKAPVETAKTESETTTQPKAKKAVKRAKKRK